MQIPHSTGSNRNIASAPRANRRYLNAAKTSRHGDGASGSRCGSGMSRRRVRLQMRLGYLRPEDDDEAEHEERERGDLNGQGVKHVRLRNLVSDEEAKDQRRGHAADGIERASVLNKPVAAVAAAAQRVQERIRGDVQHAHRKPGDERAGDVHAERGDEARQHLQRYADDSDRHGRKRRKPVALAFQDHPAWKPHEKIGKEVRRGAKLRKRVRRAELRLHDGCKRPGEHGDETHHEHHAEHHRDRQLVPLCHQLPSSCGM